MPRLIRALCLAALACLPAHTAPGGAWLREQGAIFLSYSGVLGEDARPWQGAGGPSIFQEFGLRKNLTLGYEGYLSQEAKAGQVLLFARVPIGAPDARLKQALELGLGLRRGDPDAGQDRSQSVARATWSLGLGHDHGWSAVDVQMQWASRSREWEGKIEATHGWAITDKVSLLGQLRIEGGDQTELFGSASVGAIYRVFGQTSLVATANQDFNETRDTTLRLAIWQEF